MIATRPPGFSSFGICCSISFNAPNSSFTSIRNAWKTWAKYLLGFPFTTSRRAFLKVSDCFQRYMVTNIDNCFRQCFCIGHFAILLKQFVQLQFIIGVYHIKSRQALPLIHTHIQRCIKAGRKTPFRFIKLVAAYPEVRHDPIHCMQFVQPEKPRQVTKIMRYKNHPFIIGQIPFRIFILVKSDQSSILTQFFKNSFGMTSSSECAIDINSLQVE